VLEAGTGVPLALVRDDNSEDASTPAWYAGETGPRSRPGDQGVQSSTALNSQCLLLLMNFQIYHNPVYLSYMTLQLIKIRHETKKRLH
jgi:hypothetical protein